MEAMAIQECLRKLKSEFDCSDDFLRDIIINCNVDYEMAYNLCKELGVALKSSSSNSKKKKHEDSPAETVENTLSEPFLDADILELHDMFPNMDISILAGKYWDNNNDLQKTANQILRSQTKPKRDAPSIELEYLKHKYSFIPAEQVTSAFFRAKNDYDECTKLIEEEFRDSIRAHWTEYSIFKQKYGGCSHRYVVSLFKKNVTYCKSSPIEETEEYSPVEYTPPDYMTITAERRQAALSLQNLRVLNNRRAEECRSYGKYLDATTNAIKREKQIYNQTNEETGRIIFRQHNGCNSLQYMIENGMRIDFHGLQVNEVVHYMDQIFKIARQSPSRKRITIVTGAGMHSKNNVSTIRRYIRSRLEKEHVPFTFEEAVVNFSC